MTTDFENEDNLLWCLHKWARRQDENFITEAFAHLLRNLLTRSPANAVRFLKRFSDNNIAIETHDAVMVTVETQVVNQLGRPDIVIRTPYHLVFIEAKAESGFGLRQLDNYKATLVVESAGTLKPYLIALTRYPLESSSLAEKLDLVRRWHEVADLLQQELDLGIPDSNSRAVARQFLTFLRLRSIAMERVGWELDRGVRALNNLMLMLAEAIRSLDKQYTPARSWSWPGYYVDSNRFFVGVSLDEPKLLVFETYQLAINRELCERTYPDGLQEDRNKPGGVKWANRLDLEGDANHFLTRSAPNQVTCLKEFLKECLRICSEIAPE